MRLEMFTITKGYIIRNMKNYLLNKKTKVHILITLFAIAVIASGCGKKKTGDAGVEEAKPSETENALENGSIQDLPWEQALREEENRMPYEDYVAIYDEFLDNEEPVYFTWFLQSDNSNSSDWEYAPYNGLYKSSSAYVFSDFIEKVCEGLKNYQGEWVYPSHIYHSILDCGNDGVPELILAVNGMEDNMSVFNDVWLIKYIDDKLQVIQYIQYGYRSQLEFNEYGYYQYGGANGASSWAIEHAYIGAEGLSIFDYGESNDTSTWSLYIPDNSRYQTVAEEQGIEENIEIEQFYFRKYRENEEEYIDYLKDSMWIYYELDDYYERIEDAEGIYEVGNPYRVFWDSTYLPLNTEDEIEAAIQKQHKSIGITDEIENAEPVKWTVLNDKRLETIYAWKPEEPEVISLETPPWDYYFWGYEAEPTTTLSLEVENKTPNDIIDENVWFAAMGMDEPDRLQFSDENYIYKLYGDDSDGLSWYPYMMDIYNAKTQELIYSLDFSNYYKPEIIKSGDEPFVEESIRHAVIRDGVLYVSTFHNTYASSAPQNGYITALDINDNFKILWRTQPLTCNADNFIVTDDAIICGYGFTAEDDFVYVLDRECGVRTQTIKVKTGPDWFCLKDDLLFVRCYDTDYVFNVK